MEDCGQLFIKLNINNKINILHISILLGDSERSANNHAIQIINFSP
jgi:hypothetical protein